MDEEGIAAVAVRGVVPRPLENLTFVLLEYIQHKNMVIYTSLALGSSYGMLCNAFLMLEFIQTKDFIHSILLFVLNVLWVD